MTVFQRNAVVSAVWLVFAFICAAGVFALLSAPFVAVLQILVYAGAIMVLFLFVIMMLDINLAPLKEGFIRYLPVGIAVALVMALELMVVVWSKGAFGEGAFPIPAPHPVDYSNTKAVGELLFTNYLLPFELAGVILLVAIIAAIALTHRQRTGAKRQNPAMQVRVQRDERVRLVKMDPESRQGS
jgi:NADH-quinone oxidoreductase subunit J